MRQAERVGQGVRFSLAATQRTSKGRVAALAMMGVTRGRGQEIEGGVAIVLIGPVIAQVERRVGPADGGTRVCGEGRGWGWMN